MFTRFVFFCLFSSLIIIPANSTPDEPHFLEVKTPMPGRIVKISVKAGDTVTKGQEIFIVEVMKMQCSVRAGEDGEIGKIHYTVGDIVEYESSIITPPVAPEPTLVAVPKMLYAPTPLVAQAATVIAPMIEQEPVVLPVIVEEDISTPSRVTDNHEEVETITSPAPITFHSEQPLVQEEPEMAAVHNEPDTQEDPLIVIASQNPPPSNTQEPIVANPSFEDTLENSVLIENFVMNSEIPIHPITETKSLLSTPRKNGKTLYPLSTIENTLKRFSLDMASSTKTGVQEFLPLTPMKTSPYIDIPSVMTPTICLSVLSPMVHMAATILPTSVTRMVTHLASDITQTHHTLKHLSIEEMEQWVVTTIAPKVMTTHIQSHFPASPRDWGRFLENLLGLTLIYLVGFGLMKTFTPATRLFAKAA